ncbi:MAG: hypothetical protein CBC09_07360 [Cellvibrionales bacterium TMED49]|nr:hypothetical protein [Porticoccaceae bacterium]OUU37057.1 MAG: hypothetical protein CBC09_07360 [Cellvibrionales bacterium TMED49]|tara:strand:- start:413 stop:670 length:258 start_codon:yes stop_codon:yes gene_type:complete
MKISSANFGTLSDEREVKIFTLTNASDMSDELIEFGVIIRNIHLLDRNGWLEDVVSGGDDLEDYLSNEPYFGTNVGRHANRIGDA